MGTLQDREATERWFDLLAPGYDAVVPSVFWPESIQQAGLERLEFEADDRVLDVGCGTGETIGKLPSTVTAHGVDLSDAQLETAAGKDPDANLVRGDAVDLPYADEAFDRVVSIGSILYWSEPLEALREIHRVTKPGGEILVMGFNQRSFAWWNPVRNVQDAVTATLFFRYDPAEGTQLFREAGWRAIAHEVAGPAWSPALVIATTARKAE